mmetsp:Transcript_33261/g.75941  ORF Transcript_33261/g.75941 Transcript_33261/m.75941 type:complete len:114 (+) Transcript_33261:135-476(+)
MVVRWTTELPFGLALRVESLQLLRLWSLSLGPLQGDFSSSQPLLQSDCRSLDLDRPLDLNRDLHCDLSPDLETGKSREEYLSPRSSWPCFLPSSSLLLLFLRSQLSLPRLPFS